MNYLTRRNVILAFAFIFLAGGASGALLGWSSAKEKKRRQFTTSSFCEHIKKRMQNELNLTSDQVERIEPIWDQARKEMDSIHGKAAEQVHQVIQKSNAEVAKILTPEQQAKWEAMEKERDKKRREYWRSQNKGRNSPPPTPPPR
ncbi:MAG: hypothetical protein AB1813_12965 [Verrucomicrobiota bacterium]|jgi:Spy/CpxP family protein refolding chaperone